MKIRIEKHCSLPDKKYNTGWMIALLPALDFTWITEDPGESIDGCRFNDKDAFAVVSMAWLFWSASIFIEEIGL